MTSKLLKDEEPRPLPGPNDTLHAGDKLVVQGSLDSAEVLKGLEGLRFEETPAPTVLCRS